MTTAASAQTASQYEQFQKNTMDGIKYGMKNKNTGLEILPAVYDKVAGIGEGKFAVVKDGKVGAVDTTNKIMIPIQYTGVNLYIEGRTFVSNGQKWAMVDGKGKFLTQFLYDEELGYAEGVARVSISDKVGFIDSLGKVILPCKYEEGYDCSDGLILIYTSVWMSTGTDLVTTRQGKEVNRQNIGTSGKMPVIFNKKGIVIYKGDFNETVKYVQGGKIVVLQKYITSADKTYNKVIDNTGKVIIPYEKEYILGIGDDWILIKTVGQDWVYGILSFTGQILLKPIFSDISDYTYNSNTLARVKFPDGSFFYIDKAAKCVEFDNKKCPE